MITMLNRQPLPFQVGQLAESKSFIPGYRGAWFRCEIKEVECSKGQIRYLVRYYDYDADGLEWLNLHETVKSSKGSKKAKRELMVRPQFPPIFHEHELPSIDAVSDVAVVVDGCWSVGDMVDWFEEGCYWFGTITKILSDDTVEVKLPDEPVGEGLSCVASSNNLRPSLNWSPDSGWAFPSSKENQNNHSHARLIQPVKQASLKKSVIDVVEDGNQDTKATPRSLLDFNDSISSHTSAGSLPAVPVLSKSVPSRGSPKRGKDILGKDKDLEHGQSMKLDIERSTIKKSSCSDSVSSTFDVFATTEVPLTSSVDNKDPKYLQEKKEGGNLPICLNSTSCDSIESAIMDLEELVCRVKWLKQILTSGVPSTSRDNGWEFLEYPTISKPK